MAMAAVWWWPSSLPAWLGSEAVLGEAGSARGGRGGGGTPAGGAWEGGASRRAGGAARGGRAGCRRVHRRGDGSLDRTLLFLGTWGANLRAHLK